jgi:hypothetical protein
MYVKKLMFLGAVSAGLLFSHSGPAFAGDVTNAALGCYVDTYAYDQLTTGLCAATTQNAPDPTIAHFEVVGLTTGNYGFLWTDLETGLNPGCGTSSAICEVPLASEAWGDGFAKLQVKITDIDTGATKTVSARARFVF